MRARPTENDTRGVSWAVVLGCILIIVGVTVRYVGVAAVMLRYPEYCSCEQCYDLFIGGAAADVLHGFPAGLVKGVGVLLAMIGAAFATPAGMAWSGRRIRRVVARCFKRPPDLMVCQYCRYDLSGLPEGAGCPECGGVIGGERS